MKFDALYQPYQMSRYSVAARNGMVCSSSALASSAGTEILKKGGNAVDAAIATAAVLCVVEPVSNGVGGDAFAIVWMKDRMYGLNASGCSPEDISVEKVRELGYEKMPKRGWIPVTVPGEPKAWAELSERFGRLPLSEVLKPAIEYAENGFPVSAAVSFLWDKYVRGDKKEFGTDPAFQEWYRVFTKDGEPYGFGELVKFQDLARSLRLIGETGADAFYHGEIADQIEKQSIRDGGFLRKKDLEKYQVEWVDPIHVSYRGYEVWEIPPNGQGIVALMALNILKNFTFTERDETRTSHLQFEAMKMAFADAMATVTDPRDMKTDYHYFLTEEYGKKRAAEIGEEARDPGTVMPPKSGTVYLCTADGEGNMVSYIQSNYVDFGSGIVVEDYGIALQNRGYDFSLHPGDINALLPGRKSYHTIIPGFLTKDGKAVGPFGVMGGYMQPQGHVQVMMNLIDFHLNPQMCLDAPRWQWKEGRHFMVEPDFPQEQREKLEEMEHEIDVAKNCFSFGRAEMILRMENGVYVGATESRTDGSCVGY
ncbi:gamma-glutamyltransferase family protein [Laedolimicola intestinihominis]|uniref:Gamma-glutamyltransferase family protein n=1 Tax=Laedolimicola intestinihominis TaxID=3133166 RepID=A0ABV1FL32_9FIRM